MSATPTVQNIELLAQLADIVRHLDDAEYTVQIRLFESSIGAHVRHITDHYALFFDGLGESGVNYDRRPFNEDVAHNRQAASERIESLIQQLSLLDDSGVNEVMHITTALSVDGEAVPQTSSLGRELFFLHSHTTHHQSLIGSMLRAIGKQAPVDLGVAPSTLKRQQRP